MTGNQGNKNLEMLDTVVELEKREALEYFRTDLADLKLRAAIERHGDQRRRLRFWPVPVAASALVALGLLLMVAGPSAVRDMAAGGRVVRGRALEAGTVEKALLRFQPNGEDRAASQYRAAEAPCLVPTCRAESDRTWLIEAAIYRSRRTHLRDEELGNVILASFGGAGMQGPTLGPVSDALVKGLGPRIRQSMIERALASRRRTGAGS